MWTWTSALRLEFGLLALLEVVRRVNRQDLEDGAVGRLDGELARALPTSLSLPLSLPRQYWRWYLFRQQARGRTWI